VNGEVDSVHVKRIGMEYLVGYVYIARVDYLIISWGYHLYA
jgi:hypothetical protein